MRVDEMKKSFSNCSKFLSKNYFRNDRTNRADSR